MKQATVKTKLLCYTIFGRADQAFGCFAKALKEIRNRVGLGDSPKIYAK